MKKLTAFLVVLMIVLTSCSRSAENMSVQDKLYQIEKGWTEEQVCALLGQPDRDGEMSSVIDVYYTVDSTTEAAVYYWLDREATVMEIVLIDSESGQRTVILK